MKNRVASLLFITILLNAALLTGCWNYREIEKMTIVAGLAIDKGKKSKYRLTAEIVDIGGGKEVKPVSRQITLEGDTIFDAVRNEISLAGKKLYFSHTKVVILSKEIAREGALRIVDWINRDSETRADVLLFVSKEKTAADIFKGSGITNQIMSYELADMAKSEHSLSKAPITELWDFVNKIEATGIVATLPTIQFKKNRNEESPQIMGTAVFKKDKLLGFLNGEESKDLLFVLNKIKGGLLITNGVVQNEKIPISLEIIKSKTDITPIIKKNSVAFSIHIHTTVVADELTETIKILDMKNVKKMEYYAKKEIETRVEKVIKHVQTSFGVDIFGFGVRLREKNPKIWNQVASRWENDIFKELPVKVTAEVNVKGSGMLSNTIEKGD